MTISLQTLTSHIHTANASSTAGDVAPPVGHLLAASPSLIYNQFGNATTLQPGTIGNTGGSQAHNNMMPYLVLSFCIALQGIFPSQT